MPISTQGLTTSSVESDQTNPGSPNSLTDSINFAKSSAVVLSRNNRAELLERPLCGLLIYQSPVFALTISVSLGENKQIVADRRTPPDITASAACIIIS